jgi:hypothetical protein
MYSFKSRDLNLKEDDTKPWEVTLHVIVKINWETYKKNTFCMLLLSEIQT